MSTPVSGPGQFSQRTDKAVSEANRSLPNADYGEQAAYQEQLSGAPMAQSQGAPDLSSMFAGAADGVVGLGDESTMPDVPVTDGANAGPGAGSEVLSGGQPNPGLEQLRGWLPALEYMADNGKSDAARNLVRQIQAQTM